MFSNDEAVEEANSIINKNRLKKFWCWRRETWIFSKGTKLAYIKNRGCRSITGRFYKLVVKKCKYGDVVLTEHRAKQRSGNLEYKTMPVCINCSGKTIEELTERGLKHVMPGGYV